MESEISSEPPKPENQANEFDQLAQCVAAQIRGALIQERVELGLSRANAQNLIDFVWLARGWPVLFEEQRQNIQRWSLN
jgi:hypothetical protein